MGRANNQQWPSARAFGGMGKLMHAREAPRPNGYTTRKEEEIMRKSIRVLAASATLLAACDGGSDLAQEQLRAQLVPLLEVAQPALEVGPPETAAARTGIRRFVLEPSAANGARLSGEDGAYSVHGAGERVRDYIRTQMRAGINLMESEVDVAALDVPNHGALYLVQTTSDAIVEVSVYTEDFDSTEQSADPSEVAFNVGWVNEVDAPSDGIEVRSPGFDAGRSSSATRRGGGGRTLFFNPAYASQRNVDHWVTTNWEKWQSKRNSRDWAYNRYAVFDPANGGVWSWGKAGYSRGELTDATIRSRPWSGYTSRVTGGPYDYEPRPSERCTKVSTQTINVGSAGSISFDDINCYSETEVYPNANQHSMGTAWYGRTTAQRFLDFAFDFRTNGKNPLMADYVWMSVRHCWVLLKSDECKFPYGSSMRHYKWNDSGW